MQDYMFLSFGAKKKKIKNRFCAGAFPKRFYSQHNLFLFCLHSEILDTVDGVRKHVYHSRRTTESIKIVEIG